MCSFWAPATNSLCQVCRDQSILWEHTPCSQKKIQCQIISRHTQVAIDRTMHGKLNMLRSIYYYVLHCPLPTYRTMQCVCVHVLIILLWHMGMAVCQESTNTCHAARRVCTIVLPHTSQGWLRTLMHMHMCCCFRLCLDVAWYSTRIAEQVVAVHSTLIHLIYSPAAVSWQAHSPPERLTSIPFIFHSHISAWYNMTPRVCTWVLSFIIMLFTSCYAPFLCDQYSFLYTMSFHSTSQYPSSHR